MLRWCAPLAVAMVLASHAYAAQFTEKNFGSPRVVERSYGISLRECRGNLESNTERTQWSCDVDILGAASGDTSVLRAERSDFIDNQFGCSVTTRPTIAGIRSVVKSTDSGFPRLRQNEAIDCLTRAFRSEGLNDRTFRITFIEWSTRAVSSDNGQVRVLRDVASSRSTASVVTTPAPGRITGGVTITGGSTITNTTTTAQRGGGAIGAILGAVAGGIIGSQIGEGQGKLAAVAAGTLLGAAIGGSIGNSITDRDVVLIQGAELKVVSAPVGRTITWRNPTTGNSGTVTAVREGRNIIIGKFCREFRSTITIGGVTRTSFGTACRQRDGNWRIVT